MLIKGVRVLRLFKIEGIVLYPFILLAPESPSEELINHERIHWDQIKQEGVFRFYYIYLKEYYSGRKQGQKHDEAYRNISFEKMAYENQHNKNFKV